MPQLFSHIGHLMDCWRVYSLLSSKLEKQDRLKTKLDHCMSTLKTRPQQRDWVNGGVPKIWDFMYPECEPGPVLIKLAKASSFGLKSETVFGLKLVSYSQNS